MMSYPFLEQSRETTLPDTGSDDPFPMSGIFKFLKNLFFLSLYQLIRKDRKNKMPIFSLIDVPLSNLFKSLNIFFLSPSYFNKNVHPKILQIRSPNSYNISQIPFKGLHE